MMLEEGSQDYQFRPHPRHTEKQQPYFCSCRQLPSEARSLDHAPVPPRREPRELMRPWRRGGGGRPVSPELAGAASPRKLQRHAP